MFGLFSKKPVIDIATRNWLLANYEWAMRNCGSDKFIDNVVLVQPTDEYFPEKITDKNQLFSYVFNTMRKYAGLEEWSIEIKEKEANPSSVVGPTTVVSGAPYETPIDVVFPEHEDDPIVILYSPELASNRIRLVSAFAYEISRIFCSYIEENPPGGEETYGHNVELTAVFLGFGLILTNSAVQFQQYTDVDSQGWSSSTMGCMTEHELTYALAIFCELKSIKTDELNDCLKGYLLPYFKSARKELNSDEKILWRLRNINK